MLLQDIINYAESEPNKEVCGFVCFKDGSFYFEPTENQATFQAENFIISPIEFLCKKMNNELVAVFHSHPNTKEDFSESDLKNAKNCMYPFLVYSLVSQKFNLFDMPDFERDEISVTKLKGMLDD